MAGGAGMAVLVEMAHIAAPVAEMVEAGVAAGDFAGTAVLAGTAELAGTAVLAGSVLVDTVLVYSVLVDSVLGHSVLVDSVLVGSVLVGSCMGTPYLKDLYSRSARYQTG